MVGRFDSFHFHLVSNVRYAVHSKKDTCVYTDYICSRAFIIDRVSKLLTLIPEHLFVFLPRAPPIQAVFFCIDKLSRQNF